jgi:hypothetical protein
MEGAKALSSGDLKNHPTAIVSINETSGRLPMWMIVKARADKCERRCRSHSVKAIKKRRLILTHQETSRATKDVTRTCL